MAKQYLDKEGLEYLAGKVAKKEHNHAVSDVLSVVSATSTDGVAYTATLDGVTSLYAGLEITIIPSMTSTSRTPTLNLNGLGAKRMVMPINGNNTSATTQPPVVYNDETTEEELASKTAVASKWLTSGKPVTVRYDGTYWETDLVAQSATSLYGTVPIESGGTDAKTAAEALKNLGITSGTEDLIEGTSELKTDTYYFVYEPIE